MLLARDWGSDKEPAQNHRKNDGNCAREGYLRMNQHDRLAMERFFAQVDEAGVANAQKAEELHRVIRRVSTTSKDRSYEDASSDEGGRVDGLPDL